MPSSLELRFESVWDQLTRDLDVPQPIQQSHFSLERDFQFDVAFIDHLIFVELHGGGWIGGRHNRESGMVTDFTKYNLAVTMGWRGVYATTSMISDDPDAVVQTILTLLKQPVLAPNYELSMWTARIRNLTHIGDSITHNGITVLREKRNAFLLELSGKDYRTPAKPYLIEGQKAALDLILHSGGAAATPIALQSKKRVTAQVALF